LVIFTGESNAGGQAKNTDATAAELAPRSCVQIWDNIGNATFQTLDVGTNNNLGHYNMPPTTYHGWELQLANSVEVGEWWDPTMYLIKTGQGLSAIGQWQVGGDFWTKFVQRVQGAQAVLRNMGKVPVPYVWHTFGINDGLAGTSVETYTTGVKELHSRIRDELGYVPIFYPSCMTTSPGANYNASMGDYAAEDNMFFVIDSTGCQQDDAYHWGYAGMKELSRRLQTASKDFGQQEEYLLQQSAKLSDRAVQAIITVKPNIIRTPPTVTFVEGSAGASFTISLDNAPAGNVIVAVTSSAGDVTPTPASVTFNPANWNITQTVTITSPNDNANNGDRTATITLASPAAAAPATVGVSVTDAFALLRPINTVLPVVSGSILQGGVLTCSQGTWSNSPTSYAYQWRRNGLNINGETTNTHTVITADIGSTLTCVVSATNSYGISTGASVGTPIPEEPAVYVTLTWKDLNGATVVNDRVTAASSGIVAANANELQDATLPFSYAIEWKSIAEVHGFVFALDDNTSVGANQDWGVMGQSLVAAVYCHNGQGWVRGLGLGGDTQLPFTPSFPVQIRMKKSGNNVTYSSSNDGGMTWTLRYTQVSCLTGQTTLYPRVVAAIPAAGQNLYVARDAGV
jgi:hypothetical protein